jgi:predicted transcriptional regulator
MLRSITARDLMNPKILTVGDSMGVRELARFLIDKQISGAPVVDEDGNLIGVVSLTDIATVASDEVGIASDRRNPDFYLRDLEEAYSEEEVQSFHIEEDDLSVRDIMTPTIYSVEEDAEVSAIASMMLDGHLHRIIVTRDGVAAGIISTSDLLGLLIDVE